MNTSTLTTVCTLGAQALLLLLLSRNAAAASDQALLDTLLENGTLTQAQYDALSAGNDTGDDDASANAPATEPRDDLPEISIDGGGLEVRSAAPEFEFVLGGRLHADFARHTNAGALPVNPNDGTEIRRARIELGGRFHRDWRWLAQTDLADNEVSLKDFSLSFRGLERVDLTFGHQKQPYSLSLEMSSNDLPFIERSIDNDLLVPFVDRAIGIRADAGGERWYAAGGLYGESVSPTGNGDEGWAVVGRYVYAPILEDDRVLHLGFRAARRYLANDNPVARIRDETTHFSSVRIVDTGVLTDLDSVTLFGPEAAWAQGRFSLTGELNNATVDMNAGGSFDFSSWHVAATWSLGAASRVDAYAIGAGEFKGIAPARNYRRGTGGGEWELAARLASIDLNDGGLAGGEEETFSFGGNWYLNPNVRMLFHWTRILDTDESNAIRADAEGIDIFAVRAQYTF